MEWEISVLDRRGRRAPYQVEAGELATVADLRRALAGALGRTIRPGSLYLGEAALADPARLAGVGLTTGATLRLGHPGRQTQPPGRDAATGPGHAGGTSPTGAAGRELAVVGGLAAAGVRLPACGALVVGRDSGADLGLDDREVSRRHAEVRATGSAVTVTDAGSRNGTGRDQQLEVAPAAAAGPEPEALAGGELAGRAGWPDDAHHRTHPRLLYPETRDFDCPAGLVSC